MRFYRSQFWAPQCVRTRQCLPPLPKPIPPKSSPIYFAKTPEALEANDYQLLCNHEFNLRSLLEESKDTALGYTALSSIP